MRRMWIARRRDVTCGGGGVDVPHDRARLGHVRGWRADFADPADRGEVPLARDADDRLRLPRHARVHIPGWRRVFDTIVNNSVPHKSIIQTFAPNGTQLAFVPGAAAAVDVDSITLYDMNNAPVATLSRDKSSSSWSWTLTVLQPGSPAADWRVLTAIVGYTSYSKKMGDMCNDYFWGAFLAVGVGGCIAGLVLGSCALRRVLRRKKRNTGTPSPLHQQLPSV